MALLDIKPNAVETHAAEASFDPYGRLLRMLMPSLRGVIAIPGFGQPGGALKLDDTFGLHPALRHQPADCSFNPCFLIPSRDDHRASNKFRV